MKNPGAVRILTDVTFGEIPETTIENGLTILVVPDYRFPIVSVQLGLQLGKVHSPESNFSLVPLLFEMLKEGTRAHTSREMADELDYWAIQFSADTFMEGSVLSMSVVEPYLDRALGLLAEMALEPVFPEEELEKVKARWRGFLLGQRAQPEYLSEERLYRTLYEGHPYQKTIVDLEHIDPADSLSLHAIHRERFTADRALLLFAGPIDLERAVALARRHFGTWRAAGVPDFDYPPIPPVPPVKTLLVHRPDSVQSRILLALRTLPADHPDYIRLKITNQVLGGGASSRLFLKLREEKGLTYGIYTRLKAYRTDGLLLATASLRSNATGEALRDIFHELERMRKETPGEEELQRSQAEIVGGFVRQLETPAGVGGLELRRRLNRLPSDYYRALAKNVHAVTGEDVHQIASRLFDKQSCVIIAVGDRSQLLPQLKPFGETAVFDVNGRPLGHDA